MTYEEHFLVALLITLLVECPLVLLFVYLLKVRTVGYFQAFLSGVFVSTLTLPYLWFIFPRYFNGNFVVFYGEGFVILAETFLLFWLLRCKFWKAFAISLLANLASFFIGRAIL